MFYQKIKTLPEIDGLSKDTVMTSWMAKYDAITKDEEPRRPGQRLPTSMLGNELMNKEQLYDLFQQVLNVKKFEHQLLYNAMQVGVTGHCLFVVHNKNIINYHSHSTTKENKLGLSCAKLSLCCS